MKLCCRREEPLDLLRAQQVGLGADGRGFPAFGQDVGLGVAMHLEPPADVTDIGHPRAVAARGGQLLGHPTLDGVAVEDGPSPCEAVAVEPLQIPNPGTAIEAHFLLELEIGVQFLGERAGETVGAHEHTPAGTSSTQSSRCSRSTLMYRFVDSALAWPSTAEIVGSGTAARSSLDAAL